MNAPQAIGVYPQRNHRHAVVAQPGAVAQRQRVVFVAAVWFVDISRIGLGAGINGQLFG